MAITAGATPFGQFDGTPSWSAYTVPTTQTWRYVQVKMELA